MGKLYAICDEMPFGKYRGELVGTIIEDDPEYIAWLLDNTGFLLDESALEYLREQ